MIVEIPKGSTNKYEYDADEVRPIGILNLIDQQKTDQKVLAVPNGNPRYDQVQGMDQIFAPRPARDRALFHNI